MRRGDHNVLNGSKQWYTNGDHADVITAFATVDPAMRAHGVTAFLVDKDTPGFTVGKKERKLGIRASPTVRCTSPTPQCRSKRARAPRASRSPWPRST